MTTKKTEVSEIKHKLNKINESFNVYMYDNGFMFEVSGRDLDNEYKTAKIMCATVEQLVQLVQEATKMERDE